MNFSNLSKAQLLYSYNAELTFNARVSLLVLYSNFIGVKWEKEASCPESGLGGGSLSKQEPPFLT